MKLLYGCNLISTTEGRMPSDFIADYSIPILVKQGAMTFSDGKNGFCSRKGDLAIWQMSNSIQDVTYSDDFESDFLVASPTFLKQYNPELIWASKGFVFIRNNPSIHLDDEGLRLMEADFSLFRSRLAQPESPFKREVLGRVMQIFLFDLWTVCKHGLSQMEATDFTASLFLRFVTLLQQNVLTEREVVWYADRLCITPKYLSYVCRTMTRLPASQWIQFYASFELVSLLNDTNKTLSEISDLMNFESISHFSRYVKKMLGKSPSEYRQK